jgi:hypothetical protein
MAKEVTKKENTALVDPELEAMLQEDAGKGISTKSEDNLVPLVYVLQAGSPQVQDGPAYIEGAKAGDIWLKNASNPIVKGKEGIWFMPCTMYMRWTEWIPREKGGGFVASYDYTDRNHLPAGAERDNEEKTRPRFFFKDTGNECVETRYEAGFVWRDGIELPYVIPFKSTGHSTSRGWMTKRSSQKRPDGSIWPAWTSLYKLTTTLKSNNLGKWYLFEVGDPVFYMPGYNKPYEEGLKLVGGDAKRAYALGRALEKAFEKREMREAQEEQGEYEGGDEKQDMKDEIPF